MVVAIVPVLKGVRYDGSPVTTTTGEVFWGEPGTNGQHVFYQLIHQGTQLSRGYGRGDRPGPGRRPNRSTTSIMAPALTPSVVGQLIALHQHITFVQGVVRGIDSFDQWGVELGKWLALKVTPADAGDEAALADQAPPPRT